MEGDKLEALSLGLAEEITAALLRFRWIACVDGTLAAGNGSLAKFGHPWQRLDLDFLLDTRCSAPATAFASLPACSMFAPAVKSIWARRFDRDLSDVLTLQGEIAAETAAQIDPELLLREGESQSLTSRGPREPTAYSLTLRAIPAIYRLEPSGFQAAGEMLAAALAIEPDNAAAHAWWGDWHVLMVGQGWATIRQLRPSAQVIWQNGPSRWIRRMRGLWRWRGTSAASCADARRRPAASTIEQSR